MRAQSSGCSHELRSASLCLAFSRRIRESTETFYSMMILPSCLKPNNNNGNPHGISTRPQQMSLIPWREYAFSPANFRLFFQPGASIMQISCTYKYHLMHPLAPSANSRFLRLPRRLCQQPWHSLTHTALRLGRHRRSQISCPLFTPCHP